MLSRNFRLNKAEIEETIKKGSSINGFFVYIKVLSILNRRNNGFSIVVSKKSEKTSVGRHRIKRIISSIIEENNLIKKTFKNNSFVFIFKQKEKDTFSEVGLRNDVEKIIRLIV